MSLNETQGSGFPGSAFCIQRIAVRGSTGRIEETLNVQSSVVCSLNSESSKEMCTSNTGKFPYYAQGKYKITRKKYMKKGTFFIYVFSRVPPLSYIRGSAFLPVLLVQDSGVKFALILSKTDLTDKVVFKSLSQVFKSSGDEHLKSAEYLNFDGAYLNFRHEDLNTVGHLNFSGNQGGSI